MTRNLRLLTGVFIVVLSIAATLPALGLANRVFVSQRSGNDANSCDNILTPCRTFAGAVLQLNPGGEAIVLDSGGYGPVTITQAVTIEAPAGVTAFIHPPSGDAITINAGASDVVTLRGLVLNGGVNNGITVMGVGTLNVEHCFITGFTNGGIVMATAGWLSMKGTDIKVCGTGVSLVNSAGVVQAAIDHCHLDENIGVGFSAHTTSPGRSMTTATYSSANHNSYGWYSNGGSGEDTFALEFCTGSDNTIDGLLASSFNAGSVASYSNCVFTDNGAYGVERFSPETVETRGNSTITGNAIGQTNGIIGPFSGM